ncbi:MAG: PEP/pyruvate-binding domain-containing protein [Patescibacteria group bacterium]
MYIKTFEQLSKEDTAIAGGKGASLGEMTQTGIPVPPGFVVLASTFDRFLEETDLNMEIDAALDTVNHKEIHTVENASEKIQALILEAKMPEDIATEIKKYFKELDSEYVAVRSSATAEDSAAAAWAGQLESYLNTTEETLLQNVQRCWASLFTPRAIFYRFEKDLHKQKISVAVVVQKMVESEVSGIAFSVHPVTQDHNQLIIEAGFGLGEAIVSGSVTPDSYVAEKNPFKIIDININEQNRALYKVEGGGNEWRNISSEKAKSQVLSKSEIEELSQLIIKIENHYGFPVDIEWAREQEKFYIVQSRPITTLNPSTEAKIRFEKSYTRDTSLILQQAWFNVFEKGIEKFGWENPYKPAVIHYMNDGVIEVWENEVATKWLMEKLLSESTQNPSFFKKEISNYQNSLQELQKYWDKGCVENVGDFHKAIDLIFSGMSGFIVMYYSALNENTPENIRTIALQMRDKDVFFDQNDRFLRKSLVTIYPQIKGYETTILRAEVDRTPDIQTLKKRKEHFVVLGELTSSVTTLEQFAREHQGYNFRIEIPSDNMKDILKGSTAFRGHAKGQVRVLKRKEQIGDVKEGEIIVSPMTTPDYLPAMQKAAAFITDEGGVTCHAAIVARELKKPCVIGTKFATQVLKDGDFVEVDADKGVIRVLSENLTIIDGVERVLAITRNMSFWHQYLSSIGHYVNTKDFGVDTVNEQVYITIDGTQTHMFLTPSNAKEYAEAILSAVSSLEKIEELEAKYRNFAKELINALESLKQDLTVHNLKTFFEKYTRMCAGLNLTAVLGRVGIDRLTEKLLQQGVAEKDIPEIIGTVTYPAEHTPLFESQLDLLKIGARAQKEKMKDKDRDAALEEWLSKYGHIPVNFCDEPWSLSDAQTQLEGMLKKDCVQEVERLSKIHEEKTKEAQKQLKKINNKEITTLATALAQGTYLNEFRKGIFSRVSLGYRGVFEKIAHKGSSNNWRDCFFLLPSEMIDLLEGKSISTVECVRERQVAGCKIQKDGTNKLLDREEISRLERYVKSLTGQTSHSFESAEKEIKGFSANRGIVKATAKVILSSKDFHKLLPGEILVTTMTSVDFVPVMERAGAFVTNEGGITSHASIVAREMNKPCVIGTKIATQVIKDGDLVEVDADNGIVRILEK